jgi:UDPglucose 6-dehydrogenase
MKVGVIGNGFVGHAMTLLRPAVDVQVWDIDPAKCEPAGLGFDQFIHESEIIFIAVPTPMNKDGTCHLDIVEDVVQQVKTCDPSASIVLRSTVLPGTSDKLDVGFMPEFLTEKHWKKDFYECDQWIIGSYDNALVSKVQHMFKLAAKSNCVINEHVIHMKPTEAEMIKYIKNCFLATKVSFFNEIYQTCIAVGIDFETVRSIACDDTRIGHGHSTVPGHDGKNGYGGTCFPKDMNALLNFMHQHNVISHILSGSVTRNESIDRTSKDWTNDKGRATI